VPSHKRRLCRYPIIFDLLTTACEKTKNASINLKKEDLLRSDNTRIDSLLIVDDSTYAPYKFYTSNRKGEQIPAGIIVDIWKLLSEKTKVPIKSVTFIPL
jgi:hypothetical protein